MGTIGVAVTSLPSKQMWPVQIWYGALKTHQQLFFCIGRPSSVGATPTHRNMRWSLNSRSAVISVSCFYAAVVEWQTPQTLGIQ